MKRTVALLLVAMLVFGLTACNGKSESGGSEKEASGDWKIGIMHSSASQGEENFRAVEALKKQYPDNLVVMTFPDNFTTEQETTISSALSIVSDPDVKVMIFCQGLIGTAAACQKVKEARPDVVILIGSFNETISTLAEYSDIFFREDMVEMGHQIVDIAKDKGCQTIVHYSFPRHLANPPMAQRLQIIKEDAATAGIKVVEVATPDPTSDAGTSGTQQFVLEDVPRQIGKYGPNTMFFGTNTAQLEPMIKGVVDGKAYYYPSVQSMFTGYTGALGLSIPEEYKFDKEYYVTEIKAKLEKAGVAGHFGSWVVPIEKYWVNVCFNYAKAYCEGATGGKAFDKDVFDVALKDAAEGEEVRVRNVVDGDITYDNGFYIALAYEEY